MNSVSAVLRTTMHSRISWLISNDIRVGGGNISIIFEIFEVPESDLHGKVQTNFLTSRPKRVSGLSEPN